MLDAPSENLDQIIYNAGYYNKKGLDLYTEGKFDEAIEFFYKSIKLDKKNAQSYNNIGMAYFNKRIISLAIKYLKKHIH